MIAIAAVPFNCDTIEDIAHRGQDWLRQFLVLTNGVASEKTWLHILRALDPTQFEAVFRRWVAGVVGTLKSGQGVDGKTARRSGSGGESTIQMVRAFPTELGVMLSQEEVAAKSNEITSIPDLLRPLPIHGLLLTIDAVGCQKNIAREITDQGGDYLLAVNDNKPALLDAIETGSSDQTQSEEVDRHSHVHSSYSQIVDQPASALPAEGIVGLANWPKCKKIALIYSLRKVGAHESKFERRHYISFRELTTEQLASAVCGPNWGVENRLHCVPDVSLDQDASTVRKDNAPQNISLRKNIVLNLIRLDTANATKTSLHLKRQPPSWKGRRQNQDPGLHCAMTSDCAGPECPPNPSCQLYVSP